MPYFKEHYADIRLPIKDGICSGLHRAQLGAIHAIASHFTLRQDPALIVMPTGSGKTAVLMITAFLLRATRVMIITPSRLVRNQIAEQFREMTILREVEVLALDKAGPSVSEVTKKVKTNEEWEALRSFDVVVATPQSASPAIDGICVPPPDLFDLILIDEAHHSSARTWNELLSSFPKARRVLATATPFRSDRQDLMGRFVYVYPLKEAYKDQIFGKIEFIPVNTSNLHVDLAIAKAAERTFSADRDLGLQHYLMVRTDTRTRADELKDVYSNNTGLRLKTIHGGHSYGHIKKTIEQLRKGQLDGIICVDMLGEGFDFPNLKIAAVHSPHKSLAITLQFIGRFARTNANDIGGAKFLAVPAEITIESMNLYDREAVWQDMVINLSQTRIDEEVFVRELFDEFHVREDQNIDLEDTSLSSLRPYCHVKIYRLTGTVDLMQEPDLPNNFDILHRWDSPNLQASVLIAREIDRPRWCASDMFSSVAYHLFVLYFDPQNKLLFINSTLKNNEFYEDLARSFTDGKAKILPLNQINRVLLSLETPAFYNVGMKNRLQSASAESYRTITGPSAQKVISQSDGQLYHRGHVFGGDTEKTIGFSSASKVWSNSRMVIPKLIRWCQQVAIDLMSTEPVVTNSPLDYLAVGESIDAFPEGAIGALWNIDIFKHPPQLFISDNGQDQEINIFDIELRIDQTASTKQILRLVMTADRFHVELDYHLDADTWFTPVDEAQVKNLWIDQAVGRVGFLDYLNANPTEFFFSDFSRLYGSELFPGPGGHIPSLRNEQFIEIDWTSKNVDKRCEIGPCNPPRISIHDYLKMELPTEADVVFYDHGTGEVADFITFERTPDGRRISFFHCKRSSSDSIGSRVKDYYEVCMQIVKSLNWIENDKRLMKQFQHRLNRGSQFLKGDLNDLRTLIEATNSGQITYRLVVVQPGISLADTGELSVLLASTSDYVAKSRGQEFEVWCSA